MTDTCYLFVYGTLMTVADHPIGHRLREDASLVGHGWIRACLYTIDDPEEPGNLYPGAVPSGHEEDRVFGEVYTLRNTGSLLPALDEYEACDASRPEPHEFLRRSVPVTLHDGRVVASVCYFYAWDLSRATRIPSGRFDRSAPHTR
ncbi:gamma-glutamylcyclotransferase family protein [Antarctobacter jejuensis]|uniref:gamma-glutamylcyclotransferase family protein n=1 Tax=Antarctobacter jejuensis TaxID=1439938 RepID=UPI003FD3C0FF